MRPLQLSLGPVAVQVDSKLHPQWAVVVDQRGIPSAIPLDTRNPVDVLEQVALVRYRADEIRMARVQLHPVAIRDILAREPDWGEPT